ncbi:MULTISPECIES: SpvB/TcaC N-terminal domain-containing protein [Pseudomonas]|uniref:Toxin n=1 Tax=Pseudomonas aphyarum TaxID=2942629 RepID=A0ABT5PIV6_9PSED|nr:SpvB/TcaC N-terminal domain-containing protein [Pseudomonas aphyarum]MDD0970763.1 toxin [Pseudomonas aphyarum]MDD1123837.1 toxin [Pseudomonas aphyarum]
MALDADALVTPPSIAQTASIATGGRTWGEMGATGQRAYSLPVPFLNARTLNPELHLVYDANSGNGKCGLGWDFNPGAISCKTSKGVPKYTPADVMQADGIDLRPKLTTRGKIKATRRTRGKGRRARTFSVVRYIPRLESSFDRYELWTPTDGTNPFWIVSRADGSQYCYGRTPDSCIFDPTAPTHIAAWLLVEIRNPVGENIFYEYKADDKVADPRFDYQTQRYLRQVCYCNRSASTDLYCLDHAQPETLDWLFRLIVDYGERIAGYDDVPPYAAANENAWSVRADPFRMHRFGFEVGTRRLCRQFLLYNHIESTPVLVNRLLLEHQTTPLQYNHLNAAHYMSYDAQGRVKHTPPLEYFYQAFVLDTHPKSFLALDHMPGLNDGQPYHCVDLYGEGLPGFLCQYDNAWYYREPLRRTPGTDEIVYGSWTLLPLAPNADSSKPVVQILTDLTGDGRLDWIVAQPGGSGYYTFNPDGTWSLFKPFSQFPVEFFHQLARLGDLSGDGLDSMALIGPNSVRVYANLREKGFAPGQDVPHAPDRLPLFSDARSELVSFNGMGASGMELCRIRHDEIRCWVSLGHGRFADGFKLSNLPFGYGEFDADRVRIADLDGSGAPAFIYLSSDCFEIWFNQGGNSLAAAPVRVAWPRGVRYDNLCQVTFADLQGIGCASLLLTVPHMTPQHYVYHFVSERPYLLTGCNNNMGYSATLGHRSSAQFWLDEKRQTLVACQKPVCHLPFAQMVLAWLRQDDEITGNQLQQSFEYFEGFYDGIEREFRGFGRVCQIDSELEPGKAEDGHTAPMRTTHWFHTGQEIDRVLKGTCELDDEITPLGPTLVSAFDGKRRKERIRQRSKTADNPEIAYALAGRPLRTEVCQADDPAPARLFSLSEFRYRVRVVDETPSSLLVLELETRTHQYERFMDDPNCQHGINLAWDEFGHLTHSFNVACARRRTESDEPPFEPEEQRQAWIDSHDEQQQYFYLTQTRAEPVHLTTDGHWLLGLPWRQRGNALKLPVGALPGGLRAADISFENFEQYQDSTEWTAARELTSLSQQTYLEAAGKILYPPRQGPIEQAVFDKKALAAYDDVPIVIRDELTRIGYAPMTLFLPEDPAQDLLQNLWSAQSGFFTYADASGFYHVTDIQQTASHGVTHLDWDANHLLAVAFTAPDGCITSVAYDMHTLLPQRVTDPNENIQEVRYEAGGQPLAHSFHGTEEGVPAGFAPLSAYPPQSDLSVEYALANPKAVLASAASVVRTELFSWMPMLAPETARLKRKQWIASGLILPDGHVRASALRWLNQREQRTTSEQTLLKLIHTALRQPVHSLVMVADRYPDDPLQQTQRTLRYVDGFGRELQSKQLVPPGDAFVATPEDNLATGADGKPVELPATQRWRVQSRVEYNHKGETIRVYRPYFLNTHRCINDSAMREHGYHDQIFYDAPGRPIRTVNALGHLAFDILHPWFKLSYDFNDTDDTPAPPPARLLKPPARPAKKVKP